MLPSKDNEQRQDKITKLLGEHLLKGHRMLEECCHVCSTPLIKTREDEQLCVTCTEVDGRTEKSTSANKSSNSSVQMSDVDDKNGTSTDSGVRTKGVGVCVSKNFNMFKDDLERTKQTIHKKICWATDRLDTCDSVKTCKKICSLIRELTLTLQAIDNVYSSVTNM